MSNSTDTTGCLSHRRQTRFFIMYEDFLDVAKVSEHQYKLAAFWRVLETKTNDRITSIPKIVEDCKKRGIPIPEEHLWIEIPYSEFVNRSLGTYKSSSFQVAAAESERLGFSKSRQLKRPINPGDPNSPMEDYKEYLFLTDTMQSVLNGGEYPTPVEINSPLLNSIAARKKAKKEKRAVENNSTPIENNSPSTETPIEINSTPLLKSTGNKYNSKDDKDIQKNERMTTVAATDTDSSIPSEKPKEKIILTEGGQRIYDFACLDIFPAIPPEIDQKLKNECEKLGEHIETLEQFKSLLQYVSNKLKPPYHLKNMVNALNSWLQTQKTIETPTTSSQPKQTTNLLELYQMIHGERNVS